MQRNLKNLRRSDDEAIKESGLILDFDEIARKGSISREELIVAKAYGIYHSRHAGNFMSRIVIPGGQITSVQAKALARLASIYGPGRISFTTRQCAQLHCLRLGELASFLRDVSVSGLTTFHGCGDDVRNVVACPWASICPHRRIDVLPLAQEISHRLSACRDLDNLPRKFKVSLSGCQGNCGQPHINDVGLVAVLRRLPDGRTEAGFRVMIGGGLSWAPFLAQPLYGFVPVERVADVCRAVVLLHRDHGDRYVRMFARLKFVVHRQGIDRCRELVNEYLDQDGIDRSGIVESPIDDAGPAVPERPLCGPGGLSQFSLPVRAADAENGTVPFGGHSVCRSDQRHAERAGYIAIQRIKIPKGEISADHLERIAELAELFADKHVYSSNRQNLELHGIDPRRLPALRAEIQKLGLETDHFHELSDVVSCVGMTYCPLAVSTTHAMFDRLQGLVHSEKYADIADRVLVNITGCPNSCSPYRIADIGLRGLRIRNEQQGSTEGYQVAVGGTEDRFGEPIGEFKHDDCPRVIETILDTFRAIRTGDETLAGSVARLGAEPYAAAVRALGIEYQKAVNPLELSVFTGEGPTPLDFKTLGRDVPCRSGCPANTNIPEYIRHIAHGRFDEAHRINQEDNVLPNILGRICTRPCEQRCRYRWTSILGPVRICHLKRVAADGKPQPSRPLPRWFPASGKSVAIVGGGPAGLAAARELKRFGHAVTIFEREAYLGGQVAFGIPAFRLPRAAIEEDIRAITSDGIDVHVDTCVDSQKIDVLSRQFDAVLVAAGANRPMRLDLDGLPEGAGIEGLRFMKAFNEGQPLPVAADVLVIGGGFTAVDCVRTARRLLGPQGGVSIMYRRGEAQMAASLEELEEMRQEDIRIETLVTPLRAVVREGRLVAVTFCRNVLGAPGGGKKPAFIPVEGSEFDVPCGTLIFAIGQTKDDGLLPGGIASADGHATTRPGLFLAGDFSFGSADVIHAVADGKAIALRIDEFLTGQRRLGKLVQIDESGPTGRLRDHDLVEPPPMPTLPVAQRGVSDEVELGFGPEAARLHAWRCYLCNHKFEIDQDKCIHCDWCIRVSPRNCILRLATLDRDADGAPVSWTEVSADRPDETTYIWINSDQCIRCGACINICPVGAISLRKCDVFLSLRERS
jgi:formate dehydrogenase major subunit